MEIGLFANLSLLFLGKTLAARKLSELFFDHDLYVGLDLVHHLSSFRSQSDAAGREV